MSAIHNMNKRTPVSAWLGIATMISIILVLASGCSTRNSADPDELAAKLVKVSGISDLIDKQIQVFASNLRPDDALAFRGLINTEELIKRLTPIYKRHFSVEEMQDMIAFYESKTGLKVKQLGPTMTEEGATVAKQYITEKISAIRQVR